MEIKFGISKNVIASFMAHYPQGVKKTLRQVGVHMAGYVKAGKLSGQVLNVVTGVLRRSVMWRLVGSKRRPTQDIHGVVIGSNVFYGRIHEETDRQWLAPAFEERRRKIVDIIQKGVRATLMK
jgi:hypothetical protein